MVYSIKSSHSDRVLVTDLLGCVPNMYMKLDLPNLIYECNITLPNGQNLILIGVTKILKVISPEEKQ